MMPRDVASEPPESFTEQRCVELVRPAIGDDSVPVTYLGHRLWQPTARWAETIASGRVYLAGDAAHGPTTTPSAGRNSFRCSAATSARSSHQHRRDPVTAAAPPCTQRPGATL